MEKGPIISHISLMLSFLDEEAIRAVYMVVKEFYNRLQSTTSKE